MIKWIMKFFYEKQTDTLIEQKHNLKKRSKSI